MDMTAEPTKPTEQIETIIKKYLPKEEGYQKQVIEAMNYSFLAGGKRLRPMLMLETYRMFGGKSEVIEPFMAAIEMIHTYSLIHDDLPAMDNDEYRRGRKTTHIVYGEAMAILAGDGLLNFAYETALMALQTEQTPNVAKALLVLSQKAGIYGMVGGQTVDVETDKTQSVTRDQLDFIYKLKTSALIESSMLIGAILAGATKSEQKIIEEAASEIGLAFQIQDDILDVYGDPKTFGKAIGGDICCNKKTFLLLTALHTADETGLAELNEWLRISDRNEEKIAAVTAIYDRLGVRKAGEQAMEEHTSFALQQLNQLPQNKATDQLRELAEKLATRNK